SRGYNGLPEPPLIAGVAMKRKRIDPPYKAYLLSADGSRTPVTAHGIVIELGPDLEVELDLAPHPNHAGGLAITTGPERTLADREKSGFSSSLLVRPGACNVIHVFLERHPWRPITGESQTKRRKGLWPKRQ